MSNDKSFSIGVVGKDIRESFPNKCKYEEWKEIIMGCGGKKNKRK